MGATDTMMGGDEQTGTRKIHFTTVGAIGVQSMYCIQLSKVGPVTNNGCKIGAPLMMGFNSGSIEVKAKADAPTGGAFCNFACKVKYIFLQGATTACTVKVESATGLPVELMEFSVEGNSE